jgi:hypothetical protein
MIKEVANNARVLRHFIPSRKSAHCPGWHTSASIKERSHNFRVRHLGRESESVVEVVGA